MNKNYFTTNEIIKIKKLISDLKRIRKINVNKNTNIDKILELQFFYVCDFILENKWQTDKEKITQLWEILKNEFKK